MELLVVKILYLILSAILVFLPLTAVVPGWLVMIPFYRKARQALGRIFEMSEQEFAWSKDSQKLRLRIGSVSKGEQGFRELLTSIGVQRWLRSGEVTRLGVVHGNFSLMLMGEPAREYLLSWPSDQLYGTATVGPGNTKAGYLVFVESNGECSYVSGLYPDSWHIYDLLLNWVRNASQGKVSIYTAVSAILWVAVTAVLVFQ